MIPPMSQADFQLSQIADALRAIAQQMQIQNQQLGQLCDALREPERLP